LPAFGPWLDAARQKGRLRIKPTIGVSNAIPFAGHRGYLIDAKGDIVTSSPTLGESTIHTLGSVDPSLAGAVGQMSQGIISGPAQTYFAVRPVAGTPWRVVISVPTASLFAPTSGVTLWVPWALFALLSMGLAVAVLFFFRYLDGRESLAGLNIELDRLSRIDSLAGLYNRRHLDEQLSACLSQARRRQEPLGVLLIDVDHFKQVNDSVGHAGGDRALQETARRLRGAVRSEDIVGRWGARSFSCSCRTAIPPGRCSLPNGFAQQSQPRLSTSALVRSRSRSVSACP
jgi:hypothetical protein